jgi:hypothetical protein
VCLRFERKDETEVKTALEEERIDIQGIHAI